MDNGITYEEKRRLFNAAKKMEDLALAKGKADIEEWEKKHPEIDNIATNLDKAFIRQYLSKAPAINLTLPDGTDTPEKLISALLKNNHGIAIGDFHGRNAALNFLSENMGNFKKSGGDTVYLEIDPDDFSRLSKLSISELKNKVEGRTPIKSRELAQDWAEKYRLGRADDYPSAKIKLFLAAKENGIDIVNIDASRSIDQDDPERISTRNFVWTEAVKKDREQNHKTGKYAVFGGLGHFTGSEVNNYEGSRWSALKTRGFVDDALGLPVIAFDKREAGEGEFVLRGTSANGASFYLPAGHCYVDNHKFHEFTDAFDAIPKAPFPSNIINAAKAIVSAIGLYREMHDSSECTPKQPAYIPVKPPASVQPKLNK